jgi:carbamoyl-phosphate synthase/aspartate carbamoyltransferase
MASQRGAVSLAGKHVVTAAMFDRAHIDHTLQAAASLRNSIAVSKGAISLCRGKVLGNLFFEPSTRTASSFHSAMVRLGGEVIPIATATSSAQKGETLEDCIRVMNNYTDVIAIRHPEEGSAARAAAVSSTPVINAGDGPGEHPTQALLDLFCIQQELGKLDGITITLLGDLKYGRTVHSLSKLLNHFKVKVNLVSPKLLNMPDDVVKGLKVPLEVTEELSNKILKDTDVLYVTRIQKERFTDLSQYNALKGSFVVNGSTLQQCKKKMVVMHPLPRVDEITTDVDADPRACYFRQPRYGMYLRMALLAGTMGLID